jgi:hypothetical protein
MPDRCVGEARIVFVSLSSLRAFFVRSPSYDDGIAGAMWKGPGWNTIFATFLIPATECGHDSARSAALRPIPPRRSSTKGAAQRMVNRFVEELWNAARDKVDPMSNQWLKSTTPGKTLPPETRESTAIRDALFLLHR